LLAITSFHPPAYTKYAKRCLQSLIKFFPGKVLAYVEDLEEKPDIEGVELRDFFEIPGVNQYLEKIKRVPGADGFCPEYDYQFDASKFCRKVFAQDAAFDLDDSVFWFDADCVVLKAIPEDFLRGLIAGVPFCYLGRRSLYTETGFLGFNTKHPDFSKFRARYLSYFTSGKIFSQMKGWHDCIAFDYAREGLRGNNLTPGGIGVAHVLLNSPLAHYLDHLKGPKRKELGYSPGHPYHAPRSAVLVDGE
jgi:hypothetical protein